MKQWVIDKLNLTTTGHTIGASFLHDIKIYVYFPGVFCAMCDAGGLPSDKIHFFTVYGNFKSDTNFIKFQDDPAVILRYVLSQLNTKQNEPDT